MPRSFIGGPQINLSNLVGDSASKSRIIARWATFRDVLTNYSTWRVVDSDAVESPPTQMSNVEESVTQSRTAAFQ